MYFIKNNVFIYDNMNMNDILNMCLYYILWHYGIMIHNYDRFQT